MFEMMMAILEGLEEAELVEVTTLESRQQVLITVLDYEADDDFDYESVAIFVDFLERFGTDFSCGYARRSAVVDGYTVRLAYESADE